MKWRRAVRIFHRDVGYVAAALTVIFSISGIAVNHIDDWNPNYVVKKTTMTIEPISDSIYTADVARAYIVTQLNITDSIKSQFRPSPFEIDIFFEGKTISANLVTGMVEIETIERRTLFKKMNFLHLNTPKYTQKIVDLGLRSFCSISNFTSLILLASVCSFIQNRTILVVVNI